MWTYPDCVMPGKQSSMLIPYSGRHLWKSGIRRFHYPTRRLFTIRIRLDFRIVELQGKSIDTIIEHQRSRAASDSFNQPPLIVTVAMDGDKRYLVLPIAHSLYDGWSINLLHEDVARYYAGEEYQRPRYDDILENIIASSGDSASRFCRTTLENSVPMTFPRVGMLKVTSRLYTAKKKRYLSQVAR